MYSCAPQVAKSIISGLQAAGHWITTTYTDHLHLLWFKTRRWIVFQAVILNSCVLPNLNLVLPFMIWWDCGLLPNLASMMKQKWLPASSTLEIVRFRYLLVPTPPCTCNNSCTARISFKRRVIRHNLNLLACLCMWHTDINWSDLKLIKVSI
jgi:hypothetical protein